MNLDSLTDSYSARYNLTNNFRWKMSWASSKWPAHQFQKLTTCTADDSDIATTKIRSRLNSRSWLIIIIFLSCYMSYCMMSSMRFILHTTIFSHQLKRVSIFVRKKSLPNLAPIPPAFKKERQANVIIVSKTDKQ